MQQNANKYTLYTTIWIIYNNMPIYIIYNDMHYIQQYANWYALYTTIWIIYNIMIGRLGFMAYQH